MTEAKPYKKIKQVRNLNSCIKVANDFVTPQNIEKCVLTTNELRELSDKHANREDKLQVKNKEFIYFYHRIKLILSKLKK